MTSTQNTDPSPKRQILLVDDDYYFRLALSRCLESHGYKVECAENAKHAQQLIALSVYSAVISDIQMPELNGLQLLKWINETRPMPVILITGFADLLETQEAYNLGAKAFLPKPFKAEAILEALSACFSGLEPKAKPAHLDSLYCGIPIDDFVSGSQIRYDIHVRLSAEKYLRVAHGGEDISIERIRSYREKGLFFLYLTQEDYRKYIGFNISVAQALTSNALITRDRKIQFLKVASESVLRALYQSEFDENLYRNTCTIVESTLSALSDEPELLHLLTALASHSEPLYAHSVAVSFYSAFIARALHWKNPQNLFKVAAGALFHDIGKKEISPSILKKARSELTIEEVILYESHTGRGTEILAQISSIPTDILQIVHQHHENQNGSGFPSRLRKDKIHPMSRVVCLANEFCKLAMQTSSGPPMTAENAINRILSIGVERFDHDCMKALISLFRYPSNLELFNTLRRKAGAT